MKKIVLICTLIISFTGLSAFGQGYVIFESDVPRSIWDAAGGTPTLDTNLAVALVWGPNTAIPWVDNIMPSTPTNGIAEYDAPAAWSDILNDSQFTLALDSATGQPAVANSTTRGSWVYNGGAELGISGTSGNTTYSAFYIGWDTEGGLLLTPQQAAAGAAPVGWSAVFSLTPVSTPSDPGIETTPFSPFGVDGIPEPATLAVVGLGAFSLLCFRRKRA